GQRSRCRGRSACGRGGRGSGCARSSLTPLPAGVEIGVFLERLRDRLLARERRTLAGPDRVASLLDIDENRRVCGLRDRFDGLGIGGSGPGTTALTLRAGLLWSPGPVARAAGGAVAGGGFHSRHLGQLIWAEMFRRGGVVMFCTRRYGGSNDRAASPYSTWRP